MAPPLPSGQLPDVPVAAFPVNVQLSKVGLAELVTYTAPARPAEFPVNSHWETIGEESVRQANAPPRSAELLVNAHRVMAGEE